MADYLGKKIKFNIEDNDLQKIRFNKVYGESQQATRSGKNKLQLKEANNTYNGLTWDITDEQVNINGTATSSYSQSSIIDCNIPAGTYKYIVDNTSLTYGIWLFNEAGTIIATIRKGGTSVTTNEVATKYKLFVEHTVAETTYDIAIKPMLLLDSETDTTYEPYGVMPSPDYRSKIENLEGMNILDISKYVDTSLWERTNNYFMFTPILNEDIPKFKDVLSGRMELKGTAQNLVFALTSEKVSPTTELRILDNGTLQDTSYDFKNADNIYLAIGNRNMISSDKSEIGLIFNNYNIMIKEGTVATPYVPYNSLEFKDEGKNLVKQMNWKQLPSISTGATVTTVSGYGTDFIEVDNTKNYVFSYSGTANSRYIVYYDKNKNFLGYYTNLQTNNFAKWSETGYVRLRVDCPQDSVTAFQLEEGTVATDYEPYKSQVAYFPLGEEKLMEGSYLADDGIHHSRKQLILDGTETWILEGTSAYIKIPDARGTINSVVISNYFKYEVNASVWGQIRFGRTNNNLIIYDVVTGKGSLANFKTWLATKHTNGTPVILEYELAEEEIVPYTETQQEAREKLRHFKGLNGENNITAQGTMTSTLDLTLYNVAEEDFDIYISKKGYFGALKYDINNLIDFMESNIPSIAEATESSVKIAGRDGDISLNTVYEPLPFEIVCYTEDNLTPEEKIIEEQKITSLLNSIKNQTKTFFMEREKKFYKVKYSGNLSVVRYPKHLKFTIPLKSSESYAMNFEESEIIGNGTKVSNTIKDTGAIFTIKGPAIKPIISLNNYQMKYNENILEGNSLIINSEDSTITHITSAGVKTNAMRAYNHEFPKIKNGENQLAVSSGIDDEKQVNVKWYDLKI